LETALYIYIYKKDRILLQGWRGKQNTNNPD